MATGHNKLFWLRKKMICASNTKAVFYPVKWHAFLLSRLNSWSHQDPISCGNYKITRPSRGNPISQKSGILHRRGCETCMLKWRLRKRKDPRCIRNFGIESCYGSLVKICILICQTYKKWWRTHKNLCRANLFISCSYAGHFWALLLDPCQPFCSFNKLTVKYPMCGAIYRPKKLKFSNERGVQMPK